MLLLVNKKPVLLCLFNIKVKEQVCCLYSIASGIAIADHLNLIAVYLRNIAVFTEKKIC